MLKLKLLPTLCATLVGRIKSANPKILGIFLAFVVLAISVPVYFVVIRGDNHKAADVAAPLFIIPPEAYESLEKKKEGACAGIFQVTNLEFGGDGYCTHGPEVPQVQYRNAVKRGSEIRVPGDGVQCTGDGTTGLRVQAIYAMPRTSPTATMNCKIIFSA